MPSRKSDGRKSHETAAEARPALSSAVEVEPGPAAHSPTLGKKNRDKEVDKDKDRDGKERKDALTIEDLTLPKSIVTRLAKGVLPPNTQIQGNALLAMSRSATLFINYLASHANERTLNANKKTIVPADVFEALDEIEFGFLKEPLEAEFAKYNSARAEKRTSYRQKQRDTNPEEAGSRSGADDMPMADVETSTLVCPASDVGHEPPRAKKQRVDPVQHDDAETEVDERQQDDDEVGEAEEDEDGDDDDEEEEDEEEEEEEEDEEDDVDEDGQDEEVDGSEDETQDASEENEGSEGHGDEALDGDESD